MKKGSAMKTRWIGMCVLGILPAATAGAQTTECASMVFRSDGDSSSPCLSADGGHVAFSSAATILVPGDTNGFNDVFVFDLQSNTLERISISTLGVQADGPSDVTSISADGRFVAFESVATNLVAGDTNGARDIFLRDRQSSTLERVSVGAGGAQAGSGSSGPSVSADGRYVAFSSSASNLVVGDTNGVVDTFVRDRQNGTTERVSISTGGVETGTTTAFLRSRPTGATWRSPATPPTSSAATRTHPPTCSSVIV
jgi:Tol biopolymer transport system component